MVKNVDVAIVGAGSAGLSALRQVRKATDNYVLIDPGPLGTTCARVGCMPSKALIQVANAYHQRRHFEQRGISGAGHLQCDIPSVMRHVRSLRDRFTNGMVDATTQLAGDKLLRGKAVLEGPRRIRVGELMIHAQRIILATGASPWIPEPWRSLGNHVLTSQTFFEQEDLSARMAVIGLGTIGLELGLALSRLGVDVTGFSRSSTIGGLKDPAVCAAAIAMQRKEWNLHLGAPVVAREAQEGLEVSAGNESVFVDNVLVAIGVRPNLQDLGLDSLGIELDAYGMPPFDSQTMQVAHLPIFIAGDANGCRPILHEALDEGFIAGRNAVAHTPECYHRRTVLRVVFSDPPIAVVGHSFAQLDGREFITGIVDFADESRAIIEGSDHGILKLYVDPSSARLLGSEMACPGADHLAHILALAIQQELTVFDLLRMPFYHPTMEEGLRTALRDAASKLPHKTQNTELQLCESSPEAPLC